jgi:hypothetical protein
MINNITTAEIYYTLYSICNEDYFIEEFTSNHEMEDLLYLLASYGVIYLASDNRVLLTQTGEKLLQYLQMSVELEKNNTKIYCKF